MREIKFRVWDKNNKEMIGREGMNLYTFANLTYNLADVDLLEVMQYTGLKDKNGKEIYEGDILKWIYPAGYSLAEVRFGDFDNGEEYEDNERGIGWYVKEESRFTFKNSEQKNIKVRVYGFKGYPLNTYKHEVIGNIYENPELLEVKKKEVLGDE